MVSNEGMVLSYPYQCILWVICIVMHVVEAQKCGMPCFFMLILTINC